MVTLVVDKLYDEQQLQLFESSTNHEEVSSIGLGGPEQQQEVQEDRSSMGQDERSAGGQGEQLGGCDVQSIGDDDDDGSACLDDSRHSFDERKGQINWPASREGLARQKEEEIQMEEEFQKEKEFLKEVES